MFSILFICRLIQLRLVLLLVYLLQLISLVLFLVLSFGVLLLIKLVERVLSLYPYFVSSFYSYNSYCIVNVVCIILLAFSKQYWYSVAIRFFNGLIDGTVTLAQTILAEISNSRNIALGTSFFFVGTAIGGFA